MFGGGVASWVSPFSLSCPEHCQLGGHRPLVSLDTQCLDRDDGRWSFPKERNILVTQLHIGLWISEPFVLDAIGCPSKFLLSLAQRTSCKPHLKWLYPLDRWCKFPVLLCWNWTEVQSLPSVSSGMFVALQGLCYCVEMCWRNHSAQIQSAVAKWGVAIHGGTPKSSILIWCSSINHPAIGFPSIGHLHVLQLDCVGSWDVRDARMVDPSCPEAVQGYRREW